MQGFNNSYSSNRPTSDNRTDPSMTHDTYNYEKIDFLN